MKSSIHVSIYPPTKWHICWRIVTNANKRTSVHVDNEIATKMLDKMLDVWPEITANTVVIHGWIPGPAKR